MTTENTFKGSERVKKASSILSVALVFNVLLMILKAIAGIAGASGALISDAMHSLSDVGASMIAIFGVRFAGKDEDERHPYGHQRIESIVGLILSLVLVLTALMIGYSGITALVMGEGASGAPGMIALIAAILSVIIKEILFHTSMRAGKKMDSTALKADAWHHRCDLLSSLGVLIGIVAARIGLGFMEPTSSIVICFVILKSGYDIGKSCIHQLVEASAPKEQLGEMRMAALNVSGVAGIDRLKSRISGNRLFVEMEIAMLKNKSFEEAHRLCEEVRECVERTCAGNSCITVHANLYSVDDLAAKRLEYSKWTI